MAVLSGLATGFAMTGQSKRRWAQNEVYFAGARAAAEAGLNRAIVKIFADTSHNLVVRRRRRRDDVDPTAAVNADNGSLAFLLGSAVPYYVDTANRYTLHRRRFWTTTTMRSTRRR